MRDLQIKENGIKFNVRVCGALIKDGKILLNKLKSDDFWTLVGGKAGFGENSKDAIEREFSEETGANVKADRLLAFVENFFEFNGEKWHEYLLFYLMKDDNDELKLFEGTEEIQDNHNGVYSWFDMSSLEELPVKPQCSQQILQNLDLQTVQHIING